MSENVKSFLYAWCGKQKLTPEYEVRASGSKQRPRFLCEVRVDSFDYVGVGNSTNKKDAQTNAAMDFLQYLVRCGKMQALEMPSLEVWGQFLAQVLQHLRVSSDRQRSIVHDGGVGGGCEGGGGGGGVGDDEAVAQRSSQHIERINPFLSPSGGQQLPWRRQQFVDAQKWKLEDAESVDVNSSIHGNWTLENAKSRLHQFLQQHRVNADYKFSQVGPDHNRSFIAEMSFYVASIKRTLYARESGSNKQSASKSCALSLIRQMFHLQVIDAFSGSLKKKDAELMKPFPVKLNSKLSSHIDGILSELQLTPVAEMAGENQRTSLVLNVTLEEVKPAARSHPGGVIPWSPPQPNWNPWINCNIDDGPLAFASLEQISRDLLDAHKVDLKNNSSLKRMLESRENLPIRDSRDRILNAIRQNSVVIVRGDTGCGKTTQVSQYILDSYIESGYGAQCNIIVTQPRRISAVSVSERVASERGESLGKSVGFSVRFESCLPRPYGAILFCTVGVLLRKLEGGLRGVSHVIVDEIHERDLNTDFIMVVLRDMVGAFPQLRVILMSATIDTTLFSSYFNDCPVIDAPGRAFPVQEYYLEDCIEMLRFVPPPPLKKKNKDKEDEILMDDGVSGDENLNRITSHGYSERTRQAMAMITEGEIPFELIEGILAYVRGMNKPGAVLVFLPGWNVIVALMRHLQAHPVFGSCQYVIMPLHSQIPRDDQRRVFQVFPSGVTKIILSTNIAETSITINDVVFVIDFCRVKMKLFTSHNNLTQYATVWASKSNLEQRRGRAGRVQHGFCFHLVSRARHDSLEQHTVAEIFRTPLHEIALAIKFLRLGQISGFLSKAVEPPPIDAVIESEVVLRELGALDAIDELTPLGKILARLPLDPRLGKTIVTGCIFGLGDAMCTIAAHCNSGMEIFQLLPEQRRLSGRHRSFAGCHYSDHAALLNAVQCYCDRRDDGGEMAAANFCEHMGLSMPTLMVSAEAKRQLVEILHMCGFGEECTAPHYFDTNGTDPKLDMVNALLCMAFYPNVCYHKEKRKVLTVGSKAALIHKLSVICTNQQIVFPLPFFVFGEKIRTRAVACKQMTMVTPLQLLLFGSRTVETCNSIVTLDDWINLQMDAADAARVLALRPALEAMVTRAAADPESLASATLIDTNVVDVIRELVKSDAAEFGSPGDETAAVDGRPPVSGGGDAGVATDDATSPAKRGRSEFAGGTFMPNAVRGRGFFGGGGGYQSGRGSWGFPRRGGGWNYAGPRGNFNSGWNGNRFGSAPATSRGRPGW